MGLVFSLHIVLLSYFYERSACAPTPLPFPPYNSDTTHSPSSPLNTPVLSVAPCIVEKVAQCCETAPLPSLSSRCACKQQTFNHTTNKATTKQKIQLSEAKKKRKKFANLGRLLYVLSHQSASNNHVIQRQPIANTIDCLIKLHYTVLLNRLCVR